MCGVGGGAVGQSINAKLSSINFRTLLQTNFYRECACVFLVQYVCLLQDLVYVCWLCKQKPILSMSFPISFMPHRFSFGRTKMINSFQ